MKVESLYTTQRVLVPIVGPLSEDDIKVLARERFDSIFQDLYCTRVVDDVKVLSKIIVDSALCEVTYHYEDLPF